MSHFVDTTKQPDDKDIVHHDTSLGAIDASKISLRWSSFQLYDRDHGKWSQLRGGTLNGRKILEQMRNRSLNANVLDYLLGHQHLIPKKWKGYRVVFWGTIYRFNKESGPSEGKEFIRCLYFYKALNKWGCDLFTIDDDTLGPDSPTAYPRQGWKDILHKIIDRL
ncbi:MAG: hypothetical protein UT43_C0020G0004 [Parcubacteria group bacterium GW2011_GWC1_39_29]|nr:MAG: hypothetical protein UT43_C0020G0004 [Parcubacteria group bacterium GW2011_GWC1_39_29]